MDEMPEQVQAAMPPVFKAAVDLLRRTGVSEVQFRWSDDQEPELWMAVAIYEPSRWDVGAGREPVQALMRLCAELLDGGTCQHCRKATGFSEDPTSDPIEQAVAAAICWYKFDPELVTFRRSCEGTT